MAHGAEAHFPQREAGAPPLPLYGALLRGAGAPQEPQVRPPGAEGRWAARGAERGHRAVPSRPALHYWCE